MKQEFEMRMIGELTYFLGLQVKQSPEGIFISQSKYAKDSVKRFGLDGKSHAHTPMSTSVKISANVTRKSVDSPLYRSMIGSLLYLTASEPDIAFSIGVCARFQANPRNLISLLSNASLGYSNADLVGNANDRKSTSDGCFYVCTNLVAWLSKKQSFLSPSTAEVEYVARR
ncbi:uncharacterized mitochondrial protein AtMg00810-like [Alnus glutinosa]|uniref:uncharacterized mitochondrial protein AtMg00810-like n=1 Tax=Alnus glutinosa TaxID=3517 RepID=UPI002D76C65D|nr:uncharacterized mitochondrial protein AtMg00810-like [Alnus glutinosa]